MSLGTMTVKNPRWREFINRLSGPEACNFRKDAQGKDTWTCAGGRDKTLTIRLLMAMGATVAEVVDSCIYFEGRGGFCDCEVVFNVEDSSGRRASKPNPKRVARRQLP